MAEVAQQARAVFPSIQVLYAQLKGQIPVERFYRYNDMWRNPTQQLCFGIAFIVFLESTRCATLAEVEALLGGNST